MKSHAILLHPAPDVNHPFVQHISSVSHLVANLYRHQIRCWGTIVPVSQQLLSYLIMVPENKGSDAHHLDRPKRSHRVFFLLLKKWKFLRKKKKSYFKVAKINGNKRTNLLSVIPWREEKKFVLFLLLTLRLQKSWPQYMLSPYKMKKTLNLHSKIIGKREKLCSHNFYFGILFSFYFIISC